MPAERRTCQLIDPSLQGKNWASWTVTVAVLILTFLCKGMQSQNREDYTLTVPDSVSVQQGLCVHIPCTFTYPGESHMPLYVYWYLQYSLVATNNEWRTVAGRFRLTGDPNQGDCSFSISDASFFDQGRYYFRITKGETIKFSYLKTKPQVVVTELTEKPAIWKSSEMISGEPVTITCQAPGTCFGTPPRISWTPDYINYLSKLWQQPHSNGSITYASNITITPSEYNKGQVLTCSVTYGARRLKTENEIRVDIAYMPRMVQIIVNIASDGHRGSSPQESKGDTVVAMEGNNVSLLCTADSIPGPLLIWTKGNKTLNDSRLAKEHHLLLPKIHPEDAGLYRCQAENLLGSAEATVWVTVQYPPRTAQLVVSQTHEWDPVRAQDPPRAVNNGSQLTAQEGNTLRLICKVEGHPPVEVSWIKERNTVKKWSFPPDNWLELTNLTVEEKGEYTCLARNTLATLQSTFQLDVAYAPKLSRKTNSTCWYEDNVFLCTCALQSWPPPQIQWQVDGETLRGNSSKGSLSVTSWLQEKRATSQLRLMDSLDKVHRILCLGNNAVGVYTLQFLLSNLKRGSRTGVFISGFCGALLAASICLIGFLIWFYKQRKATMKAGAPEARDAVKEVQPRNKNPSLIYGNVFQAKPRTPRVGQAKKPRGMNSGPSQTPRAPQSTANEPGELHYAALELNFKKRGTPTPSEDSVEYSEIKVK